MRVRCMPLLGCAVAALSPFRDRYNIFGFTFCVRDPVIGVLLRKELLQLRVTLSFLREFP